MSEAELPDITNTPVLEDDAEALEQTGAPVLSPQLPAHEADGFKPMDLEPPVPIPVPKESTIQSRLEELAMPNIVPKTNSETFSAGRAMDKVSSNNANAPDIGFNPAPKDIVNVIPEHSLNLQGATDIGSSILGNSTMSEMELQVQAQAIKFAREMQTRNQGSAPDASEEKSSAAMGALSATSKMLANSLGMKLPPPEYSGIPEPLADTEPDVVASKKKKKKKKKKNGQKSDDIADENEGIAVIEAPPSAKAHNSPEPMRESTPDIPQPEDNRPAPDMGLPREEWFPGSRFPPDEGFPPPHERFHHGPPPPERFPPEHFPPERYPDPHEGPGPEHPMFHMSRGRGRGGRGGMYDGPHRPPYDEFEGYEEDYGWRGRGRRGRGRPFPRHGKFRYRDDFDEEDFEEFGFQFLFQMYFFSSFSSKLEQNEAFAAPGDYLFFLLLQIVLLDVISLALAWPSGFPFLGPSLVFAILYYWSRREPYAKLSFFSFSIQGYQFPFALLFFQLLIGGNIWMDLLGLASGHIYYFLHEVVPQEYGYTLIKTPAALTNFMARQTGRGVPQAAQQQQTRFQGRGQTLGGN